MRRIQLKGGGVPVDDVLETVHHFRAIDYVIDHAEEKLPEEIIRQLHSILKHDTKDASLACFAVGDYKKRPNMVGGHETAKPEEVRDRIRDLLERYHAKETVTIEGIVAFHDEFEDIHPFQDGNGRVGRLVALKACLHYHIVPFIIEDQKKAFYYRGLANWRREKGWLTDTCLDGQDTFRELLDQLGVPYETRQSPLLQQAAGSNRSSDAYGCRGRIIRQLRSQNALTEMLLRTHQYLCAFKPLSDQTARMDQSEILFCKACVLGSGKSDGIPHGSNRITACRGTQIPCIRLFVDFNFEIKITFACKSGRIILRHTNGIGPFCAADRKVAEDFWRISTF